ncbi:MAG: uracil-DNA glycosylase, partial [Halobacteriales archaeon]|nr:uracil-DNA glycosylase [Halobacteriales archaeon]
LGKTPSQHLLDRSVAVTSEAGTVESVEIGGTDRRVVVCVHPAASLYDPSQRETLETVIGQVAEEAGVERPGRRRGPGGDGAGAGEDQSRLADF